MKHLTVSLALGALALTLTACAQKPRGPSNAVIERSLKTAPGAAQPSTIVSTEIAYARAAKEQGFRSAAQAFAAEGALIHSRGGVVPLGVALPALEGDAIATSWAPRLVVQSCDGSLALSMGRFVDGTGKVGNYVTTWVRQSDGSYKWTYDAAGLDNPQPPPRPDFEDGDIVVTAMDVIKGLVATCPRGGETLPPPPANSPVGQRWEDVRQARDGTLRWRFEHRAQGEKYVVAEYYYNGEWVTALEESLASAPEG